MTTIAQKIQRASELGIPLADLLGKSETYIDTRIRIRESDPAAHTPARVDHARVSRVDVEDRDPELDALMKRFDAAPQILRNYVNSDPWLHGADAALRAARGAAGHETSAQRPAPRRDANTASFDSLVPGFGSQADMELVANFDRVVGSRDSEGSAAINRPPSSRQVDPSILKELRSKILRDVLSTMKSPEEVAQMSAAEIARAEAAWSEFLDRALEVGISGEHANSIGGR